ncbi:HAD hydrolase family protein, partial [Enterococcus faecium]
RQLKANIFNHLKKMLNVSVTESAPVNIEIVPQNVSKGVVFDRLESIYNLKKPLRIAIGDSLNDLSMFESADISFAMGNSHQEIMKKADYVTVSNDKDGVSQAFERILT